MTRPGQQSTLPPASQSIALRSHACPCPRPCRSLRSSASGQGAAHGSVAQRCARALVAAAALERSDGKAGRRVIGGADAMLFGAVIALIVFGVVMVYSASSVRARARFGDGHHYLMRQAALRGRRPAAADGPGAPRLPPLSPAHEARAVRWRWALLLLVIFGLGHNAGGASRWIQVGPDPRAAGRDHEARADPAGSPTRWPRRSIASAASRSAFCRTCWSPAS